MTLLLVILNYKLLKSNFKNLTFFMGICHKFIGVWFIHMFLSPTSRFRNCSRLKINSNVFRFKLYGSLQNTEVEVGKESTLCVFLMFKLSMRKWSFHHSFPLAFCLHAKSFHIQYFISGSWLTHHIQIKSYNIN